MFFIYFYGCVGSLLLCMSFQAFSSCDELGLLSSCDAQAFLIFMASVVPEQRL